jgi:hypothetical protein
VIPSVACAMESVSLSPMQEVQRSKNEFEAQLNSPGIKSPFEFFIHCHHIEIYVRFQCFESLDLSLLPKYKELQIDGYSALGAGIIAKYRDTCLEWKKHLIFQLIAWGFTLTEKDKTLVALHLHDVISTEQKQMMISLLHDHQESGLAMVPHDVRRYIVDYMVDLYKAESWLFSLFQ